VAEKGWAVARRYARALLEIADSQGNHEQVTAELDRFCALLAAEPRLGRLFENPAIRSEDKRKVLDSAIAALALSTTTVRNLLRLCQDKGRLGAVPTIRDEVGRLVDARAGRARAEVVTAEPISEAALARLRVHLEHLLGQEVLLGTSTDPSLIGGVVVRVGNTVYDASVSNRIRRLRERLLVVQ
jgi:F-type H+-transporting ATPase subunit delta